jgi:hypothetical protein
MSECVIPAPALRIRSATAADRAHLIPLINAAIAIETFLEGMRTNEERLAAMMGKGDLLAAEDGAGRLLGCVYTEARGKRGYLGQLALDPAHQCKGWVIEGHRRTPQASISQN